MLDYNHRPGIAERVNAAIDAALIAEREATLAAYRAAVAEQYRFYSFGDAMLIL